MIYLLYTCKQVIGEGTKKAVLQQPQAITIESQHSADNEYVPNVTGELIESDCRGSPPIQCQLNKLENNQWVLEYTPLNRGQHQLHIKADNEHINGSPFSVIVTLPVRMLGTHVRTIDGVDHPSGLAINQQGEILVVEEFNHCVSVLGPDGGKTRTFGSPDHSLPKSHTLSRAHGIAICDDGAILVANTGENCIAVFTSDGSPSTSVGRYGGKPLEFKEPMGIAIHPITKDVFIADFENHRIQVLSSHSLEFITRCGFYGKKDGQFNHPWDVSFDSDGYVYVADSGNNRIQVLKYENGKLKFSRKFGEFGNEKGKIYCPSGICVDKIENRIYVTEDGNHRVSVFTHSGEFLTAFGTYSEQKSDGKFDLPHKVTIDKNGYIYISDHNHNCLQVF